MFEDKRHLRATWVASVNNLDWPSKASLTIQDPSERIQAQQHELITILDEAVNMRMNAVFLHIKPCSDALYNSKILPPSAYLTGVLGQDPGYDPLAFAIEQAHQRNLELHAWFNPYRVSTDRSQQTIDALQHVPATSPPSVYTTQPGWIKVAYDRFVIDPGIPEARRWVVDGIMEVVNNYDIDGVHLDDYFYYESPTSTLDDDETFHAYPAGFTHKGDWRRNNTLLLITALSAQIRAVKPYVKFGISPSGVWRNKADDPLGSDTQCGNPHYDLAYADTKLWITQGLIDYIVPQVYWSFTRKIVRFDTITKWWADLVQDKKVHLYIGEALYRAGVPSKVEPEWTMGNGVTEIKKQLLWNIADPMIQGSIFFRHLSLRDKNVLPAKAAIQQTVWPHVALVPVMPWKGTISPQPPIQLEKEATPAGVQLTWKAGEELSPRVCPFKCGNYFLGP